MATRAPDLTASDWGGVTFIHLIHFYHKCAPCLYLLKRPFFFPLGAELTEKGIGQSREKSRYLNDDLHVCIALSS